MDAPGPSRGSLPRFAWIALILAALLTAALLIPRGPLAAEQASSSSLRDAVRVRGIEEHLAALERIAADSGGNRFTGTPGYDRSVDYVADTLEEAGLDVERRSFPFFNFEQVSPTVLQVVGGFRFRDGEDMNAMLFSASADVRAPVRVLGSNTSGAGVACDPDRIEQDEVAGAIVLARPGDCFFRDQVVNLSEAGASAVVFAFPGGDRLFRPTLFTPEGIEIPALVALDETWLALADAEGEEARVLVDAATRRDEAENVIAETPGGDGDVVMLGGHLDSVMDGPGINDNGSGVASILEVAEQLADRRVDHKVRFAFWGGEEMGLLGSSAYVRSLSPDEVEDITAYLNFDMVASPNFVRFVYSAEGAPPGSAEITELFTDYFDGQGLVTSALDIEGRSDHGPFIGVGIPVGGLFTGAEDPKTDREAALYGGDVGVPHDPCYHSACDRLDNVNRTSLDQMADAIAHAVATLAA